MSRTCKRVVYKKVKRSCKNALVGGASVVVAKNARDAVNKAVNAFTVAIAKLIPNKAQQNKIDATKYYESITITNAEFPKNIILYAFIILYCAVVHNFKIEPSKANKALIDKNILELLTNVMKAIIIQYFNNINQILEHLSNNMYKGKIMIDYLYYYTNIYSNIIKNFNIINNVNDNIKIYAFDNTADKSKSFEMIYSIPDTELSKYINRKSNISGKESINYINQNFLISSIQINIPKKTENK